MTTTTPPVMTTTDELIAELADIQQRERSDSNAHALQRAMDRIRQLEEAQRVLVSGIEAVAALMDESSGVAGLHLNGDVAEWHSLRTGGHLENWLLAFDEAQAVFP